jgi:hypothetical protein
VQLTPTDRDRSPLLFNRKCLFSPVEIVAHLTRSALGKAQKAG